MATAKSKTVTQAEVKPAAEKPETKPKGPLMYIGPTLRTVPLIHDRVYTEIPKEAEEAMAEHKELRLLFVPILKKPEAVLQIRRGEGAYYLAYQAVQGL